MADGFLTLVRKIFGLLVIPMLVDSGISTAAEPIVVVTTNTILADMTTEIAGPHATVHCLMARGVELHGFEPVPADVARLANATLLIANGAGSEPWLDRLVAASGFRGRMIKVTDACELILHPAGTGGATTPDPHAWQDTVCGIRYAAAIRDALRRADPENEKTYRERARLYTAQLEVLDSWIRRLLAPVPPERRRFVTSHDSFAYFARAYRLDIVPIKGLEPGHEPDAAQLSRLIDELREGHAVAIFAESAGSEKLLERLAHDTGVRRGGLLFTDSLGPENSPAGTYLGMLRENALTLEKALAP